MISKEEIKKMADLARIGISEEESEKLRKDVEGILEYVGQIGEVEIEGFEKRSPGVPHNVFREDSEPHDAGVYTDDLISQAPNNQGNWVKVKKILGDN